MKIKIAVFRSAYAFQRKPTVSVIKNVRNFSPAVLTLISLSAHENDYSSTVLNCQLLWFQHHFQIAHRRRNQGGRGGHAPPPPPDFKINAFGPPPRFPHQMLTNIGWKSF